MNIKIYKNGRGPVNVYHLPHSSEAAKNRVNDAIHDVINSVISHIPMTRLLLRVDIKVKYDKELETFTFRMDDDKRLTLLNRELTGNKDLQELGLKEVKLKNKIR